MEGLYAIFVTPQPLTEPGCVGYVLAGSLREARHRAAHVIRIGFEIRVVPL